MAIQALIDSRGRVRVEELAETFQTSLVTIRKDLRQLEHEGRIIRAHGGAISRAAMSAHVTFEIRKTKNKREKQQLGKKAAEFVAAGDVIFIDASTTTAEMCPHLRDVEQLTVVTNSLEIAYLLGTTGSCNIVVMGGTVKRETLAMFDLETAASFDRWRFDKAFFGGWGYSVKDGLTDLPGIIVQQKRHIAARSLVKIALVDSSKVEKGSLDTVIPSKDLDYLITNADVEPSFLGAMQRLNTQLILA